jgi:HEPN domain-containing protein
MSKIEETTAMLKMAFIDYRTHSGMEDREIFAEEVFGFHVQQAVEKGFKAWLCALTGKYPLTHDLTRLLTLLQNGGCDVEGYFSLTQYNIFTVQVRYEEGLC